MVDHVITIALDVKSAMGHYTVIDPWLDEFLLQSKDHNTVIVERTMIL